MESWFYRHRNKLVSENEDARRAYEEFQARIALQQQLFQIRKAEHITQSDVALDQTQACPTTSELLGNKLPRIPARILKLSGRKMKNVEDFDFKRTEKQP